jgi:hypothetical protein
MPAFCPSRRWAGVLSVRCGVRPRRLPRPISTGAGGEWEFEMKNDHGRQTGADAGYEVLAVHDPEGRRAAAPRADAKRLQSGTQKASGDSVSWTARCVKPDMTMQTDGTVTYRADSKAR